MTAILRVHPSRLDAALNCAFILDMAKIMPVQIVEDEMMPTTEWRDDKEQPIIGWWAPAERILPFVVTR